jgi:two-component system sensor histidine kinase VicK
LIHGVVAAIQGWSSLRDISVEAPDRLRAEIDCTRIEQVLFNLLDNAIKYSPEDRPIQIRTHAIDGAVELSVRDYGPGITPEKRARIFERFYQADSPTHAGGMGLGLYVCREIVERHGGEICAEFPEDGGCRFVVRLPLLSPVG